MWCIDCGKQHLLTEMFHHVTLHIADNNVFLLWVQHPPTTKIIWIDKPSANSVSPESAFSCTRLCLQCMQLAVQASRGYPICINETSSIWTTGVCPGFLPEKFGHGALLSAFSARWIV